ncbi:MAG: hypothetical protein MI674_05140 [Cytophagales bacterium]|nr:hypothetical protein [Cytophagales bacterium]
MNATQQLVSIEKRLEGASAGVKAAYKSAKEWLGPNCKIFTKESGDIVLMSQDGLRKLRLDVIYPHGDAPHIHLEIFKNGKWRDALKGTHRIYPQK